MNRFIHFFAQLFVGLFVASLPTIAFAQDNIAAGLFTEARQLPIISHGMDVTIERNEATVSIVQVFVNDGAHIGQADYRLHLPADAVITEFGYWNNNKYLKAALQEKEEAKTAHKTAASEGRATGILHNEDGVQHFSVFPVEAGETKKIQFTFTMGVITELGRNRLRIPVDSFLGQDEVMGAAKVNVSAVEKIEGYGVEGAPVNVLSRHQQSLKLLLNVNAPFELWWKETSVPLRLSGSAVPLDDDKYAVELSAAMDDAGAIESTPEQFSVLVDGSFSMKHKSTELLFLLERLAKTAAVSPHFFAVTDTGSFRHKRDPISLVSAIGKGMYGHRTSWASLEKALKTKKCDAPKHKCIVVSDLPSIQDADPKQVSSNSIFLTDIHEKGHFADRFENKKIHTVEVDSSAQLAAMADELVLPVLKINDITSTGDYRRLENQKNSLAEGGRLTIYGSATHLEALQVGYVIDNRPKKIANVSIKKVAPDSPSGKSIRKGYYRNELASLMQQYRGMANPELKQQIIDISLREEIPTAFTSLQVDDPSLSLFSIKPGDPLLTVHNEPGVKSVIAVYPFGDVKSLVFDEVNDTFTDRFLVPRGWRDQSYKIMIFKRFTDGHIKTEYAYYQIDRKGPKATITVDPTQQVLRISPDAHGKNIGSVQVHLSDKRVLEITPMDGKFVVYEKDITDTSQIVIRDRAGNTTRFKCNRGEDTIITCAAPKKKIPRSDTTSVTYVPLTAQGSNLEVNGDWVTASLGTASVTFSLQESALGSLQLKSYAKDDEGNYWLGTALGDVVKLTCPSSNPCKATPIGRTFYGHPVVGIVPSSTEGVKLAVLGKGIYEYQGGILKKLKLYAKSRYVTGLVQVDETLFFGTLKNGLYTIAKGKGYKTSFGNRTVLHLSVRDGQLVLHTPQGKFVRKGEHRFVKTRDKNHFESGSPDLTAAVHFGERTIVAGFDGGLFEWKNKKLVSLDLSLSPMERRVNALAVFEGRLYIGTEAGLFTTTSLKKVTATSITGAVHDLAVGRDGVAVASTQGLHIVRDKSIKRLDYQKSGKGRFMSVAFWKDKVVAGNIDGLFWFGRTDSGQYGAAHHFNANFVTSLLVHNDTLYVGTYDEGVFTFSDGAFQEIKSLGKQWIPPHGLKMFDNILWVGGMGMAPRKWKPGTKAIPLAIPARDVNDFFRTNSEVLLLTSDGLVHMPN